MNDIKAAVVAILNTFDEQECPTEFMEQYDQLERLAGSHGTETFLVRRRSDQQLCVAKFYGKKLYSNIQESSILKSLNQRGLPVFTDEFRNDKMVCIVREYVEGMPLDQYRAENNLTRKDAIQICVQLCDILIYLHEQKQPVIHRDIKPQNIIIKPDGTVSLIDFDISRIYHADAKTDTEFIGTREYAPPEQYGFSQTDSRTDIYSTGVVMGWLFTGETETQKVMKGLGDARIEGIYKRCTAFSPEDRFSSARKLKSALNDIESKQHKAAFWWTAAILSCLTFLFIGFFIGRYTNYLSIPSEPHSMVVFQEPMIEQAVRLQLGKMGDTPITQEDLLTITGLYIFGDSIIAANEEDLHIEAKRLFDSNQMRVGPIRSLADTIKMPNLNQVFISMQRITDVSPLAELPSVEVLDIKNNPITDISPLGDMKFLKRVTLFDTRVTDLSPLALCPMLSELSAGKLPVQSPGEFEGIEGLRNLNLSETTLDTLDGIQSLAQLEAFTVESVIDGDLTPLLELPNLKAVSLGEELRKNAEELTRKAGFSISYR